MGRQQCAQRQRSVAIAAGKLCGAGVQAAHAEEGATDNMSTLHSSLHAPLSQQRPPATLSLH